MTAAGPLLIDRFLPRYDFSIVHAGVFRTPPDVCYRIAREVDLLRHPVVRLLLGLRGLPQRLAERRGGRRGSAPEAKPPRTFRIDDLPRYGWLLLDEEPKVEIVFGQIGRPWQPAEAASFTDVQPEAFADFDRPGFAKIAFNLRVAPYGQGASILTIETRVALTDPASLHQFRRYWRLIGPFSDLIRRIAFRLVAADLRRSGDS